MVDVVTEAAKDQTLVDRDLIAGAQLQLLLQLNPLLNRFALHTRVSRGCVQLVGAVDHPALAQLAEDIAQEVVGIGTVDNRIQIQPGQAPSKSRAPLAQRLRDLNARAVIRLKYQLHRSTAQEALEVQVDNDIAVIEGEVSRAEATEVAYQLAMDTVGIARVCSRIRLLPQDRQGPATLSMQEIEQLNAHAAFMLAMTRDLAMLPLTAAVLENQILHLQGEVNSPQQLRKAERILSGLIGVRGVRSQGVHLRG